MKNTKYEDLKQKFIMMCDEHNIPYKDVIIYCIYSEYPIATIDERTGDIEECKHELSEDYSELWEAQPKIEDDENKAFAIQHARDIYDVLLDRIDY